MNTMEVTKFVGAICGSLLVFLLISTAASGIFYTQTGVEAFTVAVDEPAAPVDAAPAELVDAAPLVAAADPAAGEAVFRRCASCHRLDGSDGVGPHLNGVVNRDIASVPGFNYSATLSGFEGAWDVSHLYAFIENPRGYAPGTTMSFAGLGNSQDRANLIAYLATTN